MFSPDYLLLKALSSLFIGRFVKDTGLNIMKQLFTTLHTSWSMLSIFSLLVEGIRCSYMKY